MTMRSFRHFVCPNGHEGTETTRENDQPYSSAWESVTTEGLVDAGKDDRGYATYICKACSLDMRDKSHS